MNFIIVITLFVLTLISSISYSNASSPPRQNKRQKSTSKTDLFRQHFARDFVAKDEENLSYQTKSDSMQLYSIAAKRLVIVTDKASTQVWDREYELSVNAKTKRAGKQNKFVTETVSYGRLKIRSEDNNHYLCAKNNGEIVFKQSASRKNKPRKRCLFNWSFTNQMHIKLSVETSSNRKWYLTVKDDIVSLTQADGSTELEKSFIWLPTKSGFRKKSLTINYKPSTPKGRAFADCDDKKICKVYKEKNTQLKIKNELCNLDEEKLEEKVESLQAEILELKKQLNRNDEHAIST